MVNWKQDIAISIVLLCLSAAFFFTSLGYPETNGHFPAYLACILAALSLFLCISSMLRRNGSQPFINWNALRGPALVVFLTAGFIVVLPYIGFIPSCVLLASAIFLSLGYPDKRAALMVAVCATVGIYVVFHIALGVSLPTGTLWGSD